MGRRLAVAVKVTAISYHAVHVKQPKLSAQLSAMGEEEKINIATYSKICSVWSAPRVFILQYGL